MSMDELDISGKRYISSKRAAKENRYHVDYIGQLIRGGKILGTKVGRTWYVEVESLAKYLGEESLSAVSTPVEINNHKPSVVKEAAEKTMSSGQEAAKEELVVDEQEPEPVEVQVHTKDVDMGEKVIQLTKIKEEPIKQKIASGLRYFSDDTPLMPQVGRAEHSVEIKRQDAVYPSATRIPVIDRPQTPRNREDTKSYTQAHTTGLLHVTVSIGLLTLIGTIFISYYLHSETTLDSKGIQSSIDF